MKILLSDKKEFQILNIMKEKEYSIEAHFEKNQQIFPESKISPSSNLESILKLYKNEKEKSIHLIRMLFA